MNAIIDTPHGKRLVIFEDGEIHDAEPCCEMSKDALLMVALDGWIIDIFKTDSGDLGMTVERAPRHMDNPCRDIFVNKETLKVSSM
jgi:hypothetical protein